MTNSTAPRPSALLIVLATLALSLAGCTSSGLKNDQPGPAAQSTGLLPQNERFTDERIDSDIATLDRVQQRLRRLNESGVLLNSYPLAKAQCWVDTARSQYLENDRTGYVEETLSEAVKIVQALEADKSVRTGYDTPLVARSSKLRDDLWTQLSDYKNQSAFMTCNSKTIACAEVRLVRAGHADEQTGWRQATPHIKIVEDALRVAKLEADTCGQSVTRSK